MTVKRWEDDAIVWQGPSYAKAALRYDSSVEQAAVAGRIIACVEVVDWGGTGGRDLLISSWDACYEGTATLRRQNGTRLDGTPELGPEEPVPGVRGYVTALPDGDLFHLISASRMRPVLHFHRNVGQPGAPVFAEPQVIELDANWQRESEYLHVARFADLGTGHGLELFVGTDSWDDYWPNGLEWNDTGYRAYDAAGRWLGGPLRGFLYAFPVSGDLSNPTIRKGRRVMAGENPFEVYGQLAPALGDFRGTGRLDLVAGEFWNLLQIAPSDGRGDFGALDVLRTDGGDLLELDHCIHLPCVTDWDGDGRPDILVGAEDGYVTWLRNTGSALDSGFPSFQNMGRVVCTAPLVHAGVLPCPAAHDFTGNGRPDLLVGNCTGELLYYPNIGLQDAPTLGAEVKLTAGGHEVLISAGLTGSIQGPSEKMFGYTCPTIADWDGDGRADVLMSDVLGRHLFLRNEGGVPPRFAAPQELTLNGAEFRTVWRVRPSVVDWLADGALHYVALDHDGLLTDYRRVNETDLTDPTHLCWQDGTPIAFTPDVGGGRGRVKLVICDWTGTGQLDLIVGSNARTCLPPGPTGAPRNTTKQAGIHYIPNVGTNAAPVFGTPVPFRWNGDVIAMGMHVASPEVVDWTGSGAPGLIVGIEDGSMVWLDRKDLEWD
ncbi:MAG: hypothetical protein ACI8R4_002124 [Paracoccaceae bacterium]|jgi:hypothetical protein